MTPQEHVDAAEACLRHVGVALDHERRVEDLAEAQAHATIVLAMATIDLAAMVATA